MKGRAWDPASCQLAAYLSDDVTGQPGQSMGEYWVKTRLSERSPAGKRCE